MSEQENNTGEIIAGITAAATAGALYLYSQSEEETKKELRGWVLKVKGDVMEGIENSEKLNRESYEKIVDDSIEKFGEFKEEQKPHVEEVRADLKGHFDDIKANLEEGSKKAKQEGKRFGKAAIEGALKGIITEFKKQNNR